MVKVTKTFLQCSIAVRVRARDRNGYIIAFIFSLPLSCLMAWGLLRGALANQWAWYKKHVTTVTSVLEVL